MKRHIFLFPRFFLTVACAFWFGIVGLPRPAIAAMSFCNRTSGAIEAALGYRDESKEIAENWVSEGWWRIESGQCARVFAKNLSQRFYFYYARALTQTDKEAPPTEWSGKYVFCTDNKAFRVEGDGDCTNRKFEPRGFREIDVGPNAHDYTLDFRDASAR